jgi:protein-disulfide isomerase
LIGITIGLLINGYGFSFQPETENQLIVTTQSTVETIPLTNTEEQNSSSQYVTPVTGDIVNNVSPDDDPSMGSENAKVLIVEFSDFECLYCKIYFDQTFQNIKKKYVDTDKVRYVIRDFPLEIHPRAPLAAEAATCAGAQNKYWEMHNKLFQNQDQWLMANDPILAFSAFAQDLNLDKTKFEDCVKKSAYQNEIAKDITDGQSYGVTKTPTFFINGHKIIGAQDFRVFQNVIESEINKAKPE